jgi:hypothetical protein
MPVVYSPGAPSVAKTQLLIDFIIGLGWDVTQESGYPLLPGPEIITSPDQEVTLTPAGGPGYVTEEAALDAWAFQARLRGPQDSPVTAELAAQQLDWMLLTAPTPQQVDGVTIAVITRLGAPPTVLPLDPSDRRTEFTCTYVITTGAG